MRLAHTMHAPMRAAKSAAAVDVLFNMSQCYTDSGASRLAWTRAVARGAGRLDPPPGTVHSDPAQSHRTGIASRGSIRHGRTLYSSREAPGTDLDPRVAFPEPGMR